MNFRPQLCIRLDDETELRILEERHAREVAELVDQESHIFTKMASLGRQFQVN